MVRLKLTRRSNQYVLYLVRRPDGSVLLLTEGDTAVPLHHAFNQRAAEARFIMEDNGPNPVELIQELAPDWTVKRHSR
jgi:hypothetical protein